MSDFSWLFILTFPNGGSTALAKLLLTAPGTLALTDRAEGQWLVPSLCAPLNRWSPDTPIDFDAVRERWTEAAREAADGSHDRYLVIEKSPPNMCRYKPLIAAFEGADTAIAILTRDPVATCASWHSRHGPNVIAANWGFVGGAPTSEREYFEALAEIWLTRAAYLDKARQDAFEIFRYEDLTADPAELVARLARRLPTLKGADFSAPLSVKDYPPQPIQNMNAANTKALTETQIAFLRQGLRGNSNLVKRLGYRI